MTKTQDLNIIRALADTYMSVQKERISGEARIRAIVQGYDEEDPRRIAVMKLLSDFREVENNTVKIMLEELKTIPVYTEFLRHVKGIAEVLSCKLIALPLKLGENLSSWNAYFGLTPRLWRAICREGHKRLYPKEPYSCRMRVRDDSGRMHICGADIKEKEIIDGSRRIRGYQSFWNPRAKVLYFLISDSLRKQGRFYKDIYLRQKQKLEFLNSLSKMHIQQRAMRYTFKMFLAHYYQASHELAGIDYKLPYVFQYLGHKDFIDWKEVVANGG